MMERVEVYSAKDGKAAMGVYVDDVEVACPVIPYDQDGWLKDWSDGDLNCAEAERKGITPNEVSAIIEHETLDIRQQIIDKAKIKEADMQDLDVIIKGQLEDAYGKGTEYKVITHEGMEPEAGLMYGNDECIEDFGDNFGKLYTYFQPYDSWMVYKCYYTIPEGETDWSNIDYSSPDDIEISDSWGYDH